MHTSTPHTHYSTDTHVLFRWLRYIYTRTLYLSTHTIQTHKYLADKQSRHDCYPRLLYRHIAVYVYIYGWIYIYIYINIFIYIYIVIFVYIYIYAYIILLNICFVARQFRQGSRWQGVTLAQCVAGPHARPLCVDPCHLINTPPPPLRSWMMSNYTCIIHMHVFYYIDEHWQCNC